MTRPFCLLPLMVVLGVAGCGSAPQQAQPPIDRQLELLQRGGRAAYEAGNARQAVNLYQQALNRALLRADPAAVAKASFDLAAAQARARQYDAALQTLAAADSLTLPSTRPQRQLLTAQILFELDRLDEAAWMLDEAGSWNGLSADLLLAYRGLIAAKRGDASTTREAISQLNSKAHPALRSRLAGLLAELDNDDAAAAMSYQREADAHRARGNFAATVEALARAGAAYERIGKTEHAVRCFLLAAQSARIQKLESAAEEWEGRSSALMSGADAKAPDNKGKPDSLEKSSNGDLINHVNDNKPSR